VQEGESSGVPTKEAHRGLMKMQPLKIEEIFDEVIFPTNFA
jgi:hypothetical protein